MIHLVRC